MTAIFGNGFNAKRILFAVFLGTASTPLYYIVVLTYFTLLAPFLLKVVHSRKMSIIIFASTPVFILFAYAVRFTGNDIWNYCNYSVLKAKFPWNIESSASKAAIPAFAAVEVKDFNSRKSIAPCSERNDPMTLLFILTIRRSRSA